MLFPYTVTAEREKKKSLMNMACLAVSILLLLISFCKSDDQMTHAKPLSPGDMLISKDGTFALGFFSPSSPTNSNRSLYVGIWYHNIPERTVVWVANRDNPITTPSSAKLVVTNTSDLALSDSEGRTLWTTTNHVTTGGTGAAAVLLNSGNLVLQSPPNGTTLWQSFDHPTDTILPNMPFLLSSKGRIAQRIVSWKGPDDPSTGEFSFGGDPSSNLQLLLLHGTSPYWRQKPWNSAATTGEYQTNTNSLLYAAVFMREDDMYLTFSGSLNMRLTLDYTGMLKSLIWNSSSSSWTAFDERPGHGCERYASCGPFGYCDNTAAEPTCKCLDGFKPAGLNFSRGCLRKEALKCGGEDHFVTLPGMKVPDKFLYIRNRSFDQCAAECSSNCSCTAYAYANLSMEGASGDLSRCLVWMVDLVDTATNSHGAENLYLRLAGSPVQKKSDLVKIVLPATACLLIFTFLIGLVRKCKYKGKQRKKEIQKRLMLGFSSAPNELAGENIEFPFTSFEDVIAATDNFCESNILGKGGFGKVYKGMLGGDKEVAIKRLSRGSGQGIEEFRNEVVLIAKLQHRNLVRLLGCCIHEDEKLLIYEYLPNKSLDAFLFEDVTRNSMLDWPTRFKIIKGIARGLLYLHQDSRLTIIHRDLKASNILLDAEMNPKISDFGMARIFGGNQQQANTCRVVGTYGYMSPEYVTGGAFSVKSDTYSFGVLLLEIVSGLKISSPQLIINFPNLIAYAWILWEEGNARELVDSSVVESCPIHEVLRCIHVGLLCVQNHPNARPLMSSVVFMLENETTLLPAPKQPAYFAPRNYENGDKGEIIEKSSNTMSFTTLDGR